jgi:predicted ATP-grasp superfamily ATP-dependent carboligase
MRILITDGDNRSALAATRSLGKAGHEVHVAGIATQTLASASRYCQQSQVYPDPASEPEGFLSAVRAICIESRIDILMPMTEVTTLLLTQHRQTLPAGIRLPFPDFDAVAAAADKSRVLEIAQAHGVPIPRTVVLHSALDGQLRSAEFSYPVVLKAARSRVWNGSRWISTSVSYADNPSDLIEKLRLMPAEIFPILAQERIEGPGVGVFVCFDSDSVIASFAHRRIREKPPSGGQSVLCESIAVDPTALEHAATLLRALRWRGVAMVEFKKDMRDGSLRLMEINGRFWGSLQLAIDAGVDFPLLLADLTRGVRPASTPTYRLGAQMRWLWGDVDSLMAMLTRSRQALKLPPAHPGRLRYLLRFLIPWRPGMKYEIERLSDPGPALLETRRRILNQ